MMVILVAMGRGSGSGRYETKFDMVVLMVVVLVGAGWLVLTRSFGVSRWC